MGERNVDQSIGFGVTRNTYSAHSKFSENTQAEKVVDRTGKLVGENSSNAQIRTLLDEQRQMIIAEYCEKIGHHELQAARAEEERRLLQGQLWRQQQDFREAHQQSRTEMEVLQKFQSSTFDTLARRKLIEDQNTILELSGRTPNSTRRIMASAKWIFVKFNQQSLTEMEELRKFQSSTFNTPARRKLIEDQNTILELSGRVQELQNEVNCMNDSKDFQEAETIRSGNSHVTSRPVSFPPHPIPEGMLRHSFVSPSRREGPPSIWDNTWYTVFPDPLASSSVLYPQELHHWNSSEEPLHSSIVEKSERPGPSAKDFSHLQWRRLLKELWKKPTTTAYFGSSLGQVPYTSDVCLLEDKVQDRGMYLFAIPYGSNAMDQRSGDDG